MSDNSSPIDPEKLDVIEFKMVKGQVDVPEDFDSSKVEGYDLEHILQLGFNVNKNLAKVDLTLKIKTKSNAQNSMESICNFHLVFIYEVDNLEALAKSGNSNLIEIQPALASALSSITYSTTSGILLIKL